MHLLLTDRLACPRCGPRFGLILLAERMEDRRVLEGRLGCPNCRDHFPITAGFGDLRAPPRVPFDEEAGAPSRSGRAAPSAEGPAAGVEPASSPDPSREETMTLAALLGVAEGPGHLALLGSVARHAAALADLLDGVEVVAVGPELRHRAERPGVSRLAARPGLPFHTGSLRGVALSGPPGQDSGPPLLDEAIRVTGATGRVVVLDAGPDTKARLEQAGLSVVLDESAVVVGSREPAPGGRAGKGVALPVFPGPPGRNA